MINPKYIAIYFTVLFALSVCCVNAQDGLAVTKAESPSTNAPLADDTFEKVGDWFKNLFSDQEVENEIAQARGISYALMQSYNPSTDTVIVSDSTSVTESTSSSGE